MDNRGNTGEMDNTNVTGGIGSNNEPDGESPGNALDETVSKLIAAILECEEYLAYRTELDKVLQVPELKRRLTNTAGAISSFRAVRI